MFDPDEYRSRTRDAWDEAAPGWGAHAAAFQEAALPVSQWLVDAIHPHPGMVVVELAAGAGETGFLAVERIQPGGRLLSTDGSEAMIEQGRARAAELGLGDDQVQFRVMEAEWLDLSAATVDAILCRWGYMLLADPESALRESRRVLRPGGRVALAAWAPAQDNPWSSVMGEVLADLGLATPPDPSMPGMFAFAPVGLVEDMLEGVGFTDVETSFVDFAFRPADLDVWWSYVKDTSPSLRAVLPGMSPADHYALRDAVDAAYAPFVTSSGALELPARALMASATA